MDLPLEPQKDLRKWYAKKRYIIPLGLATVLLIAGLSGGNSQVTTVPNSGQVQGITTDKAVPVQNLSPTPKVQEIQPQLTPVVPKQTPTNNGLSNNNYYTNVDGNEVHSPAYSNSVPAGASAQCRDGTYSFSQNRRGTCSHHGGVSEWY